MAAFSPIASTPIAAPIIVAAVTADMAEAASASDTQAGAISATSAVAETGSATDALLEFEIITETLAAADAVSMLLTRNVVVTERAGARESVLNGIAAFVTSEIAEAVTASDLVKLPTWTNNPDDTQTWSTNTPSGSVWTNNSHAESTWTEN